MSRNRAEVEARRDADTRRGVEARLAAQDVRVDETPAGRLSVAPDRERATPFADLLAILDRRGVPAPLVCALGEGVVAIVEATRHAFPGNLFWDLDHVVVAMAEDAQRADDPLRHAARATEAVARLHRLFGEEGAIRFRYIHDFLYGHDWARWVQRSPAERSTVGPFDLPFLERMLRRGRELVELIDSDDPTYPRIEGSRSRNPFSFQRDADSERALYRDLAAHRMLPVETYLEDAEPVWDRPFEALRTTRAKALGLWTPPA